MLLLVLSLSLCTINDKEIKISDIDGAINIF